MPKHKQPIFILKLSTGYVVEVDLNKSPENWLSHLANAIIGERFLQEAKQSLDRGEREWHLDVIPEEIRYLLATTDPELKDILFHHVIDHRILKVLRRLEKRAAE